MGSLLSGQHLFRLALLGLIALLAFSLWKHGSLFDGPSLLVNPIDGLRVPLVLNPLLCSESACQL